MLCYLLVLKTCFQIQLVPLQRELPGAVGAQRGAHRCRGGAQRDPAAVHPGADQAAGMAAAVKLTR